MTDTNKARKLLRDAGLAFPVIPKELLAEVKERGEWVFSTRPVDVSPYDLTYYLEEAEKTRVIDYAVLAHSGHGINSYAIQYYLVHGPLRMFLHLGWGGDYEDQEKEAAKIRACFLKADEVVRAMVQCAASFHVGEHLTVVGSDFYGSYWIPPGTGGKKKKAHSNTEVESPLAALTEVLDWLASTVEEAPSPKNGRSKRQ